MPDHSQLLDILRPEDMALMMPSLAKIRLEAGRVLTRPGEAVEFCYFPCGNSLASFAILLDSGEAIDTLIIGREGAVRAISSNGLVPAFARASVIHGGYFYRIPVRDLDRAKEASSAIRTLFSSYADWVMAQVFQSLACNAAHSIEQRAAKWLLATVDRMRTTDITMTQEQLANMMGVGRSYASRVVQRFKSEGLLRTRRGGIVVTDEAMLKRRACTCHARLKQHYATVFAGQAATAALA